MSSISDKNRCNPQDSLHDTWGYSHHWSGMFSAFGLVYCEEFEYFLTSRLTDTTCILIKALQWLHKPCSGWHKAVCERRPGHL